MPKFITMPQQTDAHCGPAVVQALLAFYQIDVSQDDVVNAARVKSTIMKKGMVISQIAKAVKKLAPNLNLWFKENTSETDLKTLINTFHLPVVINWQGLFYRTQEEERLHDTGADKGHFSIVTDIDVDDDLIVIDDPYSEFYENNRLFSYKWIESRWWDTDAFFDKKTKQSTVVRTERLVFVLTPKDLVLPSDLMLLPGFTK